ncbi:WD40 repeat domain-containing protein [Starkeya sp. ORNL1]|uniref:caspase family protein n=1 Tax=Starkeya sp. ORNL1 TaxID=2709380 RepID=UPI0014635477|nr:caspase family protein [Starkeya sp. ORNL1]QJP14612.1 WD40 repeat domain-containing protein [Starkeya sp. ORNL1]
MDARSVLRLRHLVALAVGVIMAAGALPPLACQAQPAGREDRARGEIRLTAPLSSVPSTLAVSPDGRFVLASTADGSVSTFDLNSRYGQTEVLISAPIRDEELQKQRPIALSPSGDLIALGVPLERNVADSARVYFFKRSDNKRILYSIDQLPSRPLKLAFTVDSADRLLLVALFADEQPPRVWDVTKLRDAARAPATHPIDTDALRPDEDVLPEPVAGFFSNCDRSECHSFGVAVPPNGDSEISLVIGGDSGIVFYDRNFEVAAYGYTRDGRQDMRRVSGISFSPDGKRVAISRRDLAQTERDANESCAVHVYDFEAMRATGPDRRINAQPLFKLRPGEQLGEEVCYFAHLVWNGDAIFAAGNFVQQPPAGQPCRTFRYLDSGFHPYANMMVRWAAVADASPSRHCLGTNVATDLRAIPGGGVAALTQDPSLIVFDASGNVSTYPAQPHVSRFFEGPTFDIRNGSRGALVTNSDGSIVMLRPLGEPRPYVAFDLMAPLSTASFVSVTNPDQDASRAELLKTLAPHRSGPIKFGEKPKEMRQCLGITFPKDADSLDGPARAELTASLGGFLRLRPIERVLTFQFLDPASGETQWHIVLGTTHRLLYARCDKQDVWNGKTIAETPFPGIRIRNEAYQLAVSGDRKFVIAAHADGILRWYRMSSGQNVMSAFLRPDLSSWIAWTAEGYFDYSFTSGSQVAGWVQSIPTGGGSWRIDVQPLSRFNEKWHKPDELQKVFVDAQANRNVTTAEVAPDTGRPQLQVAIIGGDKIVDGNVRLSIRASSSDATSQRSPLTIAIDGFGRMESAKEHGRRLQSDGLLIDASFDLPECLRHQGKNLRIEVNFEGAREGQYFTYAGPDSAACPQKRIWGVAVGISDYGSRNSSLKYADQDAQRFFDFWKNQGFYKVARFALLTAPQNEPGKTLVMENGKQTTSPLSSADYKTLRDFMQGEFKKIAENVEAGDVVLMYFAGHGFSLKEIHSDYWFFMPNGTDVKDAPSKAIGIPKIVEWLGAADFDAEIPLIIFVDACRDLRVFPDKVNPARAHRAVPDFTDLYRFDATLFLATGDGASAFELPEKDLRNPKNVASCEPSGEDKNGGGAFTHVLLEVLNGKNVDDAQNGISLDTIELRLKADVKNICGKQHAMTFSTSSKFPGLFFPN